MHSDALSTFYEQLERIKLVTGKQTQVELADFLGTRQAFVSDARRRGKIPSNWLVTLMCVKGVSPEWILTGNGPCFVGKTGEEGRYETGDEMAERKDNEEALRRLPSRMLADELVRRISVSQINTYCVKE